MQHVTLLFLVRDGEVLLAMKKRGFGVGKWNGVGGKVEPGESPRQAAARECQEEIGVRSLEFFKAGEFNFLLSGQRQAHHFCHIFICRKWHGQPVETEEMRPQWFATHAIPYDNMWADDKFWLPKLLAGKKFRAELIFQDETLVKQKVVVVKSLEE